MTCRRFQIRTAIIATLALGLSTSVALNVWLSRSLDHASDEIFKAVAQQSSSEREAEQQHRLAVSEAARTRELESRLAARQRFDAGQKELASLLSIKLNAESGTAMANPGSAHPISRQLEAAVDRENYQHASATAIQEVKNFFLSPRFKAAAGLHVLSVVITLAELKPAPTRLNGWDFTGEAALQYEGSSVRERSSAHQKFIGTITLKPGGAHVEMTLRE